MKTRSVLCGTAAVASLGLATARGQAPIAINASDMFNQVGQYYRGHANVGDVDVGGRLGTLGGPQAWDFTTGPEDRIFRFDYVAPTEGGLEATFPAAAFAERKTDESDGSQAWMYLRQQPGQGRINYGFHDPAFSDSQPTSPFTPPIVDFPEVINFGDAWTANTTFDSEISLPDIGGDAFSVDEEDPGGGGFAIPIRVTYSSSAKADAYGLISLPGSLGFGNCLRVNELSQWDIAADLGLGEGYQTISTQFTRNYYWLRNGRGIVVQITSKQGDVQPQDEFPLAAAFVRMFETNHPDGVVEVPTIKGFKLTLSAEGGLLTWTKASGVTSYRVEYTTDLANPASWQVLSTTSANFALDESANKPGFPARLYRVVGTN